MTEVLRFYLLTNELKYIIRTGWKYWAVPSERLESIAEHVYGTCMLAIAIDSEYELDININRVIKMLVCHELEELIIGDITPFDVVTEEEKLAQGRKAVEKVLGNLIKKDEYIKLLNEFDTKETKEAKFAFYCDKLEFYLQGKIYDDAFNMDINKADNKILNSERIIAIREKGISKVSDIWFESRKELFENNEIFLELSRELNDTDTSFVLKKTNEN